MSDSVQVAFAFDEGSSGDHHHADLAPGADASAAVHGADAGQKICRGCAGEGEVRRGSEEGLTLRIQFVVPGTPVGKGRPKFARRGNFVTAYTPEKTASYENLVKVAAQAAMRGIPPFEGAVAVGLHLFVTPPASWSQKKQRAALSGGVYPTSKPDVDNVIKGIFDAMNEIVWKDDKQAVDLVVTKRYGQTAQAIVEVISL